MTRISDPLLTPQSVTNKPKELAQSNPIERPRRGNRAAIVMLTLAVAFSMVFTAGVVVGMKMTNDYYEANR
jgi:ferric-dicitrate binding protein FerR (iron transport regulator)